MLSLLLTGCGKPVPPEKLSYIGFWQAKNMELTITAEGRVEYWRKDGASSSKISAPIQRWEGNDFFVGLGAFSTRFKVEKPPGDKDGVWTMTVDGVELKRVGPGAQWTGWHAAGSQAARQGDETGKVDRFAVLNGPAGHKGTGMGTSFPRPGSAPGTIYLGLRT